MASTPRYLKPNMAAMPADIGRKVISEIMNSTPVDQKKIHIRNERIMNQIRAAKEKARNDQSGT